MTEVTIHTDGSCWPNPGPGGYCAILSYGEHRLEVLGGSSQTTNNRMELTAVIEGLAALTRPCSVLIITDSTYVKDGMQKWLPRWRETGWRTKDKKPVKNKDLWLELSQAVELHDVHWSWVRGHDTEPLNVRADELAGRITRALSGDKEVGKALVVELEQRRRGRTTAARVAEKHEQILMAGHRRLDAEFDERLARD